MDSKNLKAAVGDAQRLSTLLDFESAVANLYGRWAPSRELLFIVHRVGAA